MKTFFLTVMLLIFCTKIYPQNSFGGRIGYNNTNATETSQLVTTSSLNRFQAGIFAKLYVHNNWYLKGNFIYNQKGNFHNETNHIADDGKKVTIRLNYLEVSIDAGYTIKVNAKQSIHIGSGPYLAYGINGTEKGNKTSLSWPLQIDKKIDFVNRGTQGGTNMEIKQIDVGVNFNIQYQYKNYGLFINYGLGLVNRETYGRSFNRVATVGLSYNFIFKKRGTGCFTG